MLRLVAWLMAMIVAITLLRAVIGWLAKGLTKLAGGEGTAAGKARSGGPSTGKAGLLVKDPVCGVYIAAGKAVRLERNGETWHFCSPECRNRFLESRSGAGA